MRRKSKILPCAAIELTRGFVALVDADIAEWLSQWPWRVDGGCQGRDALYAMREEQVRGKRFRIFMHSLIVGDVPPGQRIYHVNGLGLDNRRSNLLVGPPGLATALRGTYKNKNGNQYKGVSRGRPTKGGSPRFVASISVNGHRKYLGAYPTPEEAAAVYDRFAILYYGPNVFINFPDRRAEYVALAKPENRPWAIADDEGEELVDPFSSAARSIWRRRDDDWRYE